METQGNGEQRIPFNFMWFQFSEFHFHFCNTKHTEGNLQFLPIFCIMLRMPDLPRPDRKDIPVGESPCNYCPGKCCRYFALPIDTPESRKEYDNMRWFILHEKTAVFVDDDTWYLLVYSPCNFLDKKTNRCLTYETRPNICREYSSDKCEYEDHHVYDQYFELPEQIEDYAEAVMGPRRGQPFRSQRSSIRSDTGLQRE